MAARNKNALKVDLPSDLEVRMTRVFDAPRRLVFEAWTRPEHVKNWWGRRGSTLSVCEIDVRPGGAWRYVIREADGQEHPFHGVYHEVDAPRRLVHTFIYDVPPYNEVEAVSTVTFDEHDGKTTLTEVTRYPTTEARDGHLPGMEEAAAETLDRLDEVLQKLL
jgi:uncharacterized protein YndB with AHSA1/START domain